MSKFIIDIGSEHCIKNLMKIKLILMLLEHQVSHIILD